MMDSSSDCRVLSARSLRRRVAVETERLLANLGVQQEATLFQTTDINKKEENMICDPPLTGTSFDNMEVVNDYESASYIQSVNNETESYFNVDEINDVYHSNSDYSSDSDIEEQFKFGEFGEKLREWVLKSGTPIVHTHSLLSLLKPYFPCLPKDARTLLQTKHNYEIENIAGGQYHHFGISDGIASVLERAEYMHEQKTLNLQVNVDGVPLFKSTSDCFWPILGLIREDKELQPFIIGLWVGKSKPCDANAFLKNFIEDIQNVMHNGIHFYDKKYTIAIENFVCDSPARSFIKITKGHCAYQGCDFCKERGTYFKHRMTFPNIDAPLRSNISFNEMECTDHHRGPSDLRNLNIGMITQFPLDYMHLICLGVMKKLITIWMSGPLHVRLGSSTLKMISDGIQFAQSYLPREFSRKGRKISEVERWKATEFRTFLLYTGPVVLRGKLSDTVYKNFLMLLAAVTVLCDINLIAQYLDYVEVLLRNFVRHVGALYGREMLVYNVHVLVHLADQCRKYGPVQNFSGFPFENYLQSLKRLIRKPKYPLQQVIRRINEKKNVSSTTKTVGTYCKKPHHHGPLLKNFEQCAQYKQIFLPNFFLSTKAPDNAVTIAGDTYIIQNIVCKDSERYCMMKKFKKKNPSLCTPLTHKK